MFSKPPSLIIKQIQQHDEGEDRWEIFNLLALSAYSMALYMYVHDPSFDLPIASAST